MKSEWRLHLFTLIVGGLTYSVISFAYMNANFTSKDIMEFVIEKINSVDKKADAINNKLDRLIENQNH